MAYALLNKDATIKRFPYTISQLKKDNPGVCFPKKISGRVLADFGVTHVKRTTRPIINSTTQRAKLADPVLENGEWVQPWVIEQKTDEEAREDIDQARLLRKVQLTKIANRHFDKIMEKHSQMETSVWPVLLAEARAHINGEPAGEYLMAEIGGKYTYALDLARAIVEKAEAQRQIRANLILVRQEKAALIDAAMTISEIEDIDLLSGWPS